MKFFRCNTLVVANLEHKVQDNFPKTFPAMLRLWESTKNVKLHKILILQIHLHNMKCSYTKKSNSKLTLCEGKEKGKKFKFHKLLTFYIKKIENCKMFHIKCIHMIKNGMMVADVNWDWIRKKISFRGNNGKTISLNIAPCTFMLSSSI